MTEGSTTVVIPAYRAEATLPRLLASVAAGGQRPAEVIVVDDGTPGFEPCRQEGLNLRFLQVAHRGPVVARNVGWQAATTDWVIFVDSDCTVAPGWHDAYRAAMRSCPHAGVLEGPVHETYRVGFFRHWADNRKAGRYPTANVAYRRHVLKALGGLDPVFQWGRFYFREDSDLALRAMALGPAVWVPDAVVEHHGRPISFVRKLREACRYALDPAFVRRHGRRALAIDGVRLGPLRIAAPRQISAVAVIGLWIAAAVWTPAVLLAAVGMVLRASFIVSREGLAWQEIPGVLLEQICEPLVMAGALGAGAVRLLISAPPPREVDIDSV